MNGFVFGGVATTCPGVDFTSLIANGNMRLSNHFCNNHTIISGMRVLKSDHVYQVGFFCRTFNSSNKNGIDEYEGKQ